MIGFMRSLLIVLCCLLVPLPGLHSGTGTRPENTKTLLQYYQNADFEKVVAVAEKIPAVLSDADELLVIESLARSGRSAAALDRLREFESRNSGDQPVLTTKGWLDLACGKFASARKKFDEVLGNQSGCARALMGEILASLYLRQYDAALQAHHFLEERCPEWLLHQQTHLIGVELYSALGNSQGLYNLYMKRSGAVKKENKKLSRNLKATAKLYRGLDGAPLYETSFEDGSAEIPIEWSGRSGGHLIVKLPIEGKNFRVILDTGNATGWMVHSRELHDLLKLKRGGRTVAMIGTEAQGLDGYFISTKSVDFGAFHMRRLFGLYVPKPYPDFYDANLNPIFIRGKVITIDTKRMRLVLRTREEFENFLSNRKESVVILPWYGYEQVFLPAVVNGVFRGIGMIETGAEDIALRLDVAREIESPLIPKQKYLANGQVYHYFETPLQVYLGRLRFGRERAEVWPFERFYHRLSGVKADVIFGPGAFGRRFAISFDPFLNRVVLEYF
jgi:hypothetical protein